MRTERLLPLGGGVRYPFYNPWKPYFEGPRLPPDEPAIAPRPLAITGDGLAVGTIGVGVGTAHFGWEHRQALEQAYLLLGVFDGELVDCAEVEALAKDFLTAKARELEAQSALSPPDFSQPEV